MTTALRTADFDFALPDDLIAQQPARPRDAARMLVVSPDGAADMGVRDLPGLLRAGDVMVVNDTRVIPARLHARRGAARVEVMLNRAEGGGVWHALIRNARRLRQGDVIEIEGAPGCTARVMAPPEGGTAMLDFGPDQAALAAALEAAGEVPLPPYIAARRSRRGRRRTTRPSTRGRTARSRPRPPALHFTDRLFAALDAPGCAARRRHAARRRRHLPAGEAEDTARDHRMHAGMGRGSGRNRKGRQLNQGGGQRASWPSARPRCACSKAPRRRTAGFIPSRRDRHLHSARLRFRAPTCC